MARYQIRLPDGTWADSENGKTPLPSVREGQWIGNTWLPAREQAPDLTPVDQRPSAVHQAAVHEAGHAVVALSLGYQLESVRINDDGSGRCRWTRRSAALSREELEEEATIIAAGPVAQGMLFPGQPYVFHYRMGGETAGDADNLDTLCHQLADGNPDVVAAHKRAAVERAKRQMACHRSDVERLAAALVQRRYLSGGQATAIFRRQPEPATPPGQVSMDVLRLRHEHRKRQAAEQFAELSEALPPDPAALPTAAAPAAIYSPIPRPRAIGSPQTTWAIAPSHLALVEHAIRDWGKCGPASPKPAAPAGRRSSLKMLAGSRSKTAGGGLAVLGLYGVLDYHSGGFGGTDLATFAEQFEQVLGSGASTILIHIDSPGGGIYGVPEIAERIRQARSSKRIIAIADPMACSAAYWIGSAAKEFYALPSGDVGSIGVYVMHAEYSKALDREGIKVTIVREPQDKAAGNPMEPLSESAGSHLRSIVHEGYQQFLAAVAANRGKPRETIHRTFGGGLTVTAHTAASRGMIDGVMTWEQLPALLNRR